MIIEEVPITQLATDSANARHHPKRNLEAIRSSLQRFGQQKPIVVAEDNVVVAGNGTLDAARELGWDSIRIVRTTLADAERIAFAIADNRTSELAEWDTEVLPQLLASLKDDPAIDELVTGFDAKEITRLIGNSDIVEDEIPEPPKDPITKPDDMWTLGRHSLRCADSTTIRIDAVNILTDPPYGLDYEYEDWDDSDPDVNDELFEMINRHTGPLVYFCGSHNGLKKNTLLRELQRSPCKMAIWHKPWSMAHSGIGNGRCHWEPIIIRNVAKGANLSSDVIVQNTDRIPGLRDAHSCPKPVDLFATLIRCLFPVGDICDPFMGSGTALMAAEQLDRTCHGIEISPAYCDVIVQRWENFTGKKAEKQS